MSMHIGIKRAYEPWSGQDGFRILVDRLWPRGISKQEARIDLWLKDIAPSSELRKWFAHDPEKWEEFQKRYREELEHSAKAVREFLDAVNGRPIITLVYGAKDEEHNQAVVLRQFLKSGV